MAGEQVAGFERCSGDLLQDQAKPTWPSCPRIGILGGEGAMGRFFRNFFADHGFRVIWSDLETELTNEEVIRRSDVVLASLPLHLAPGILQDLVPSLRPGQLLLDVCSLKVPVLEAVRRAPCWVVGLHPMFGPYVPDLSGQTMIVCPERVAPIPWQWLIDLLDQAGLRVHRCSKDEHDRMMTVIQLIPHMATAILGHSLRHLNVDPQESLRFTSPMYRLELDLIGRLFAQDPELYAAIAMNNPFKDRALEAFQKAFDETVNQVRSEDMPRFVESFLRTRQHFGSFCDQALAETNKLLTWHHQANNGRASEERRSSSIRFLFDRPRMSVREKTCTVTVGVGNLRSVREGLKILFPRNQPFVVADEEVWRVHEEYLREVFKEITTILWPASEKAKRLDAVEDLAGRLLDRGAHRGAVFLALGGGVTGDLVGFLASIFMRGVPVVQIPTSLLAQVDSCLGGKTGVDLGRGKNLLGSFHHPGWIIVDPNLLETLPEREWQNGMAEVIKMAFLDHGPQLDRLENLGQRHPYGVSYPLPSADREVIVADALRLKARLVAGDERDWGVRQLLNLGHTAGHALEAYTNFELPHGHAVALGMRIAFRIGVLVGCTSPSLEKRLERILKIFGLPTHVSFRVEPERWLRFLNVDKKRASQDQIWILVKRQGMAERRSDISKQVVRDALKAVQPASSP